MTGKFDVFCGLPKIDHLKVIVYFSLGNSSFSQIHREYVRILGEPAKARFSLPFGIICLAISMGFYS